MKKKKLSYPKLGILIGGIFTFLIIFELIIKELFFLPYFPGFFEFFGIPPSFLMSLFISPGYHGPIPVLGILWFLFIIIEPILIGVLIGSIIKSIKERKITKYSIIAIVVFVVIIIFWTISIRWYLNISKGIQLEEIRLKENDGIRQNDSIKLPNIK